MNNLNVIKWLVELDPTKKLNAVLFIVILVLGYVVMNRDAKNDVVVSKSEVREDRKQAKIDSLQLQLVLNEQRHRAEMSSQKEEFMDYLKQSIIEQKQLKSRVKKVDKKVDNVISQTKEKLNSK